MTPFQCIDTIDAQALIEQGAKCFDIRDINSFELAHPKGATHLHNDNIGDQLSSLDEEEPILVFCYHGISSQNAAQYIAAQGFSKVYSVNGGFEQWQRDYPNSVE